MADVCMSMTDKALHPAALAHFINGKRVPGSGERRGSVFDPAAGDVKSFVPLASRSEVNEAVLAASAGGTDSVSSTS